MPANLTPQYHAAEEAFKAAETSSEKIAALEEMLAIIPKHKGTEKLQAEIKKRIAKLREEGEKKGGPSREDPFHIERQGAGQVALLGYPNSGKSSLVSALTRAQVVVADYPFSTPIPVPGMMPYEDILIQLVDTPPVTRDFMPSGLAGTLRNADRILLVIDASSDDCLEEVDGCLGQLRERRILRDERIEGVRCLTLSEMVFVPNKIDLEAAQYNLELLQEALPSGASVLPVSAQRGDNLERLKPYLFEALGVIRVYSKIPGKAADMTAPFVLKNGATVLDFAEAVHREFPDKLKNARVWGSARFDGQSVPRDFRPKDKDIVELHID